MTNPVEGLPSLEKYCHQIHRETGAVVHIHTSNHPAFTHMESLKLSHETTVHSGRYCRWFRQNDGYPVCRKNKLFSMEIAKRGRVFSGTCPNGIWEMAIPVFSDERFTIIVYLGHLLLPGMLPKSLNDKSYTGNLPSILTPEKKEKLRHYGHFLAQFIKFELATFAEDKKYRTKQRPVDFYFQTCENYIEEKYNENISLKQLAENLKVNANYLGALLKQRTGKTFRQLLTDKRLTSASLRLVLDTDNVSEIAYECGFTDSNYFCKVFAAEFGISPLQYRKRHRSGKWKSAP